MDELWQFFQRAAAMAVPVTIWALLLERRLTRLETLMETISFCPIEANNCPVSTANRKMSHKANRHD